MTPEELLAWRRARGLNQAQVAEHLGVRRQTVIGWERRQHAIPDDLYVRLEKMANGHDVTQRENENTGRIIRMDYPELFDPVPGSFTQFIPNRLHPMALARRGLLGWPGCTWRNASPTNAVERRVPLPTAPHRAILGTEHYVAALEDFAAGVKYHPAVAGHHGYEHGFLPYVREDRWEPWDGLHYWAEMPPVTD